MIRGGAEVVANSRVWRRGTENMSKKIEFRDLRRILLEGAGVADGAELDVAALDTEFDDLGYDSLAIMETAARISREYAIRIDEDALAEATTPRQLLDLVNSDLSAVVGTKEPTR
jgi:act minimal PKS acyl carrier protein